MSDYMKLMFDPEANTTVTTDIEPAISIDHSARLNEGIAQLERVLGITNLIPMAAGSQIKIYKNAVSGTKPAQVAEGETIPLTKVTRKLAQTIEMGLNKYRKKTTAEAIQRDGYENAVNGTDRKLIAEVRKEIKDAFYATIKAGAGTATAGATLQAACANLWGALQTYFEDMDVVPVFFINPMDVAEYLGTAAVTTQTAFGLSYIENFLGLGTAFVTTGVDAGAPCATVIENCNGAYVPVGGDVARTLGLTYDETGLVGMTHTPETSTASLETLIMSGVRFYAEDASGVFKGSITQG